MITDPHLMPDFRDGLEQALYRRASLPVPLPERRRLPAFPRLALGGRLAVGTVVLIAALAVILTSLTGNRPSSTAVGEPLLLAEPTVAVPSGIEPGNMVRRVLGPTATFEGAIPFEVRGGTAYALQSQRGWCISMPGIAPGDGRSTECATDEQLRRVGFITYRTDAVGQASVTALVPPNSAPPTLLTAAGVRRDLPVSSLGVVSVTTAGRGDHVVLHAKTGEDLDVAVN